MKKDDLAIRASFTRRFNEADIEVPVQKVEVAGQTAKQRTKDNEVQLNVHINADLMKTLKLKGVNEDKNIKQMLYEAIKLYLST